jgi:hypothetical protein
LLGVLVDTNYTSITHLMEVPLRLLRISASCLQQSFLIASIPFSTIPKCLAEVFVFRNPKDAAIFHIFGEQKNVIFENVHFGSVTVMDGRILG